MQKLRTSLSLSLIHISLRIAHICQQSDIRDAGIVDQYIQITACAVDVPEYLIRLFRLSHIAKHDITGAMIGSLYGMPVSYTHLPGSVPV